MTTVRPKKVPMAEYVSKLPDGLIPAHTVCPWRNQCSIAENGSCAHMGVEHSVAFSCGGARLFDCFREPTDMEVSQCTSSS